MGSLRYDGAVIEFDDRLLAHLHVVIIQKLRRKEGFTMSWLDSLAQGNGRSSIWLDPSIPIYFKFAGSRSPIIDPAWIQVLGRTAESSSGLLVTDEEGNLTRSQRVSY